MNQDIFRQQINTAWYQGYDEGVKFVLTWGFDIAQGLIILGLVYAVYRLHKNNNKD